MAMFDYKRVYKQHDTWHNGAPQRGMGTSAANGLLIGCGWVSRMSTSKVFFFSGPIEFKLVSSVILLDWDRYSTSFGSKFVFGARIIPFNLILIINCGKYTSQPTSTSWWWFMLGIQPMTCIRRPILSTMIGCIAYVHFNHALFNHL